MLKRGDSVLFFHTFARIAFKLGDKEKQNESMKPHVNAFMK
jgi:hypothetical protein